MKTARVPLCVDLDGTLIHSDLLLESLLLLVKKNPLYLFAALLWVFRGKAYLKAEISRRVNLNPATLPYNKNFFDWISKQKESGRQVWLCTASNHRLANLVALHLGIFDGVISSSDSENLSGAAKAKRLTDRFGEGQFDYCGNHHVDISVWAVSRGAVLVNASAKLAARAKHIAQVLAFFPGNKRYLQALLKALRVHQWAKNVLLLIPVAAAHKFEGLHSLTLLAIAFLAFSLCASSVYLLNDLLDLEVDRQHLSKKSRPFASGNLSLLVGIFLTPTLLLSAIALSLFLPREFSLVLLFYYTLTLAYSFWLKRIVLFDIVTLAGLYTIRIVAGAAAVNVPVSFWLLLFSVFLFLSLALLKRYAELDSIRRQSKPDASGRGYNVEDLPILHSLGTAAGYMCIVILALYINSPAVEMLYREPKYIWLLCIVLLYWVTRMWLMAYRGVMHDDPVLFALKDKTSLGILITSSAIIFTAI